jgi:hypothetical protein
LNPIALLFLLTLKYTTMNTFNLLINYVIASTRASYYNIPGNQEVTNTALLTGMVSENPLLSYLIIDNKAKIEGEKFGTTTTIAPTTTSRPENPSLPPPPETVVTPPTETKGTETPPEGNASTLEEIRKEILANTTALANITSEFGDLKTKITNIEGDNKKFQESLTEIQTKLNEFSEVKQTPDTVAGSKNIVAHKASTKTDKK